MSARSMRFLHAAGLMAATSVLVPVVGIATAPILAHGLGVDGRGSAAAALAPGVLIASGATLGLPDALTYCLAKVPERTRAALVSTAFISLAVGAVALLVVVAAARLLAGGTPGLQGLIELATVFALPQLLVGLLRGAAFGRQLWGAVAAERILNSFLRLIVLVVLLATGHLTVLSAVVVMAAAPVVAGAVYWRLALRPVPASAVAARDPATAASTADLLRYGSRMWLGSVASIVMSRLGPLLVTPLSDVRQLGLLTVAVTVADVPFIVATSLRDLLFGSDSRERDAERLALTTRASTLAALLGSVLLGATLPLWIDLAFGRGFAAAVPTTWVLLASIVVNVPGWMAGAGLSAWGRPELRSAGLVVALLVNLGALLVLVPPLGAFGAALAALLGSVVLTVFTVFTTARTVGIRRAHLLVPQRSDLAVLGALAARLRRR